MNYFYDLPDALKEYIFELRDNEIAKNVKIIQRSWRRYNVKIWTFYILADERYFWNLQYPLEQEVKIIEFIEKKIKKTDKIACSLWLWKQLLNDIYVFIQYKYLYEDNNEIFMYYNRIEKAFNSIIFKLDMEHFYDNEPEHFMYM